MIPSKYALLASCSDHTDIFINQRIECYFNNTINVRPLNCTHYVMLYPQNACLHWLRVPERIDFKVAVLTYKVLHGSAPRYLGPFAGVANLPGRRTLRSGGTSRLTVPSVRRSTVGDRAFSVAGPRVWNTLPKEITTSQSLLTFRQQLKTWLSRKSYPDIII